jgi:glycosyltransferase involved in cell wall biosynthesis
VERPDIIRGGKSPATTSMLTISAIIPTHNRAKLLVEAIESALQQTRPPDEIIVVDDGSTDDTEQVVTRYDGRVRYIRQENSGPSAARNRGIQAASGDFIAFLDSDDLWVKDRIERQLAVLASHPNLDVIFGLEGKFTDENRSESYEINEPAVFACLNTVDCVIPDPFGMLLGENFFVGTSTVLFRKSCVATVGLMDARIKLAEDYDFWVRFALNGFRFGFINAVLCGRRMHEGNLVNQKLAIKASVTGVLSRYRDRSPAHRERVEAKLSNLHYDLGSAFLKRGDWSDAYTHLTEACPLHQSRLRCRLKIAAAYLFRSLPGKRTCSVALTNASRS